MYVFFLSIYMVATAVKAMCKFVVELLNVIWILILNLSFILRGNFYLLAWMLSHL